MFINAFQIEEFIEFIVDDTENKQKLYLEGTSLQIKSSEMLSFGNVSLCVLCLNIDIQEVILKKHKQFIAEGGIFASVYSMQKNSLFKMAIEKFQI